MTAQATASPAAAPGVLAGKIDDSGENATGRVPPVVPDHSPED